MCGALFASRAVMKPTAGLLITKALKQSLLIFAAASKESEKSGCGGRLLCSRSSRGARCCSRSRRALALAVTTQLAQVRKPRTPRLYHF